MAPIFLVLVIGDIHVQLQAKILDKLHILQFFIYLWYNLGYYSVLGHDANNVIWIDKKRNLRCCMRTTIITSSFGTIYPM